MRLDEIRKFESIVYNILEKTVDKGTDVNIDLALMGIPVHIRHLAYGEILETNYWSQEGIVNIAYMVGKPGTPERQKYDWRYRPLTGAMFDDAFTIKKIDGVPTFTAREQQDD